MRQRALFILCVVVGLAGFAAAQGRTVTNADLEKFKQKRVQAEKGLKEYYAKLGLTPAEVEKREAEETKAREELSLRLREQRLERERIEAEMQALEAASVPQQEIVYPNVFQSDSSGYVLYGNQWIPNNRFRAYHYDNRVQWRATPMGVVWEPGSRPSSIWAVPPRTNRRHRALRNPRALQ